MDFDKLRQLIENSLLKNKPLAVSELKSAPITQISKDFFPSDQISIQEPKLKDASDGKSITICGKGVDLPFKDMDSELFFYLQDGEVALSWTATGDREWSIATSFPMFKHTFAEEINFSKSQIVLNSHEQEPDKKQGMFFEGTINLDAMTGGLSGLLGKKYLDVSGPVIIKNHGSEFKSIHFSAPKIEKINLGIATVDNLSFSIENQLFYNSLRKRHFVIPYILLSTEIPFSSQGKEHNIPVSVRVSDLESDIRFSADPEQLVDAGLDEIKSLTNNIDLTKLTLPDTFHIEDILTFKEFFFDFNLKDKQVTLIGVGVESTNPWHVFHLKTTQQDLIVQNVGLRYRLFDPFGAKNNALTLSGEVALGKSDESPGVLVLHANYPNWFTQGYLKKGTQLNVAETLQTFLGSSAHVPDLQIDEFNFEMFSGDYSLRLDMKSDWQIPLGLTNVGIERVGFYIHRQAKEGIEAAANGTFSIATVELDVEAKHPSGSKEGWTFTGKTDIKSNGTDISTFVSQSIDKVFPGSTTSNVPSILDVDIRTLAVDFNTQTKDFHFNTDIDFGKNKDVKTVLTFSNLHQEGADKTTFEKRATGVITVFPNDKDKKLKFDLGLDLKEKSKHFIALYNNTSDKSVSLGDLIKAMFPDASVDPPDFNIRVKDAMAGYISDSSDAGEEGKDKSKTSQAVFAVDMGASVDLSSLGKIPLVGQSLSAAKTLKLAFQVIYPAVGKDKKIAQTDLKELNKLITAAGPKFPDDKDLEKLFLKTELRLGDGKPIDFNLPVTINKNSGKLGPKNNKAQEVSQKFDPPGSQSTDDGVKWFQLGKKFGPLHLQKAGFKFDAGKLTALLDGGLTALGLEVDLMDLSMTTNITDVSDYKPEFGLDGLGIEFSKGGVEIAGLLLHLEEEYDGLASVQAENLRLAAIGSLTTLDDGHPSLFIYAVLDYPLGGTPAFYVTGLAGGFGLNRRFVIPDVDQVSTFPLVAEAENPPEVPTEPDSAGGFIAGEMEKLQQHIVPDTGQYFGCAGIRFSSFEMIDSFVLASLSFGHEFEIDLLGLSSLVVPPKGTKSPALAKISLQIAASFIPAKGMAIVQGQLTKDSYLLDSDCHLTGGFAFAGWFGKNPHAGDFVVTLGGYHPDFTKPDYYPSVPRIGVNWKISSELSITGKLYFALTPRAMMAGGSMHALFQNSLDLGIASVHVKAWFNFGADFIVYWKPFHYAADAYVNIGLDVIIHFFGTHHITLNAGADLTVWGSPFSGHAHVYFKVIGIKVGFNVDFGGSAKIPPLLVWDAKDASKSFRQSFLPGNDKIVSVAIGAGLVRKVNVKEPENNSSDTTDTVYVINPKDLVIETHTVIPVKECDTQINWEDNKKELTDFGSNTEFGIAPMEKNKTQVDSFHRITVTRDGNPVEKKFILRPVKDHVPGGLWAQKNSSDINAKSLIENVATGFKIMPAEEPTAGETKAINREEISYSTQLIKDAFSEGEIKKFSATKDDPENDPANNKKLWEQIQNEIHDNKKRDAMMDDMGFDLNIVDIGEPFSTDAAYAPQYGKVGDC